MLALTWPDACVICTAILLGVPTLILLICLTAIFLEGRKSK